MNKRNLIVVLFVIMLSLMKGQIGVRSSVNLKDYKTKVDTLPFFVYDIEELDTLFTLFKRIPVTIEKYGINCISDIYFKIDINGKIGFVEKNKINVLIPQKLKVNNSKNIDITNTALIDSLTSYYSNESFRLVKLTEGLWFSDSLKAGKLINVKINFNTEMDSRLRKKSLQNDTTLIFNSFSGKYVAKNEKLAYNFGVRKFSSNKVRLAKVYFEQVISTNNKDIDAYYNLGTCYLKLKKQEKACENWNKCVDLGDKSALSLIEKYCK